MEKEQEISRNAEEKKTVGRRHTFRQSHKGTLGSMGADKKQGRFLEENYFLKWGQRSN